MADLPCERVAEAGFDTRTTGHQGGQFAITRISTGQSHM